MHEPAPSSRGAEHNGCPTGSSLDLGRLTVKLVSLAAAPVTRQVRRTALTSNARVGKGSAVQVKVAAGTSGSAEACMDPAVNSAAAMSKQRTNVGQSTLVV
jgi:hypothetical protein